MPEKRGFGRMLIRGATVLFAVTTSLKMDSDAEEKPSVAALEAEVKASLTPAAALSESWNGTHQTAALEEDEEEEPFADFSHTRYKKRFCKEEEEVLYAEVLCHWEALYGERSHLIPRGRRASIWQSVAAQLNAYPGATARDGEDVRKKFNNLRSQLKGKVAAAWANAAAATAGGGGPEGGANLVPPPPEFTPMEIQVLARMNLELPPAVTLALRSVPSSLRSSAARSIAITTAASKETADAVDFSLGPTPSDPEASLPHGQRLHVSTATTTITTAVSTATTTAPSTAGRHAVSGRSSGWSEIGPGSGSGSGPGPGSVWGCAEAALRVVAEQQRASNVLLGRALEMQESCVAVQQASLETQRACLSVLRELLQLQRERLSLESGAVAMGSSTNRGISTVLGTAAVEMELRTVDRGTVAIDAAAMGTAQVVGAAATQVMAGEEVDRCHGNEQEGGAASEKQEEEAWTLGDSVPARTRKRPRSPSLVPEHP